MASKWWGFKGGMPDSMSAPMLKTMIYYSGWLYFLAAPILATLLLRRSGIVRAATGILLAGLSVLAYARFVEPSILTVKSHDITLDRCFPDSGSLRLAVFSDTHIGIFANAMPIARIMRRVSSLNPDAALIAGDLTYHLSPQLFAARFAALGATPVPVYAVLGNHDVGFPGQDVSVPLVSALDRAGATVIDNDVQILRGRGGVAEIVGLSDLWQGRYNLSLVAERSASPRLVLTHNPMTAAITPHADLLIAGHTHGGQIYIPFFTCAVAKIACRPLRYGEGVVEGRKVFVTSGTGMVGLPMRFLVPPRVDLLNISWRRCTRS